VRQFAPSVPATRDARTAPPATTVRARMARIHLSVATRLDLSTDFLAGQPRLWLSRL